MKPKRQYKKRRKFEAGRRWMRRAQSLNAKLFRSECIRQSAEWAATVCPECFVDPGSPHSLHYHPATEEGR